MLCLPHAEFPGKRSAYTWHLTDTERIVVLSCFAISFSSTLQYIQTSCCCRGAREAVARAEGPVVVSPTCGSSICSSLEDFAFSDSAHFEMLSCSAIPYPLPVLCSTSEAHAAAGLQGGKQPEGKGPVVVSPTYDSYIHSSLAGDCAL